MSDQPGSTGAQPGSPRPPGRWPVDVVGGYRPAVAPAIRYDGFGVEDHSCYQVDLGACRCGEHRMLDLCAVVLRSDTQLPDDRLVVGSALDRVVDDAALTWSEFGGRRFLSDEARLAVYATTHDCPVCSQVTLQVVGYGEFQPARWMAIDRGGFELPCI